MNAIEITVIIACVLIVAGVIVSGIINKKKGKSSCGCCNGCPYCKSCKERNDGKPVSSKKIV